MLVLSRKTGERIHIGEDITVEIRRIAGNRVTLALQAPRDVRILRGELERVAKEFEDQPPKPNRVAETVPSSAETLNIASHDVEVLSRISTHDVGPNLIH